MNERQLFERCLQESNIKLGWVAIVEARTATSANFESCDQ